MMFGKNPSLLVWTIALLTALACSDESDVPLNGAGGPPGGTDPGSDSGGEYIPPTASCDDAITGGTINLTDATNYTFDSTVSIQEVTVKDATNLTFDWGGLTTDFFGQPLNPVSDIDMVLISLWEMTSTELAENIRNDNLPLSVNKGGLASFPTDEVPYTSQNLYSFVAPVDRSAIPEATFISYVDTTAEGYQYPQSTHTFMLVAASGTTIGKNSRMMGFFHVDPAATETTVALNDGSMVLDYTTNLSQIMPLPVPSNTGAMNVSWEYMTMNALGNDFDVFQITEVMIGHYTNYTRPQLDEQFLNLMDIADRTWSGEVTEGYSIDLDTLVDDTGAPFAGVDSTGVWIMALFCTKNCNNPAPWSITILQAC